jgi:carboxyl-terminal processing protease
MTLVVVLGGAALFVSGFTLGQHRSLTPGTSADRQERFQAFWDTYNKITSEYVGEYDEHRLVEGAIGGLFQALGDPYSAYMSSEDFRQSLSGISGQFEGIGAEMASRDAAGTVGCKPLSDTCRLTVTRLVRNAPAEKAGLKEGDVLLLVDGTTVAGLASEEVITKVRGPKGTTVKLTVERAGATGPTEVSIVRDVIAREDVTSRVLANGTVGYLKIDGFSSSAADDFKTHLRELVETSRVRKVVLDLRRDPGGFVDAARTIASQFVGSGPIYWEEFANGTRRPTEAEPGGIAVDPSIQLVLLVDGGTASASEIVAGALKDTGRAQLIGEKTFGKGTIQQWQELGDYGGFRLSTAKWLTPNQTWIHGTGIQPDIVVAATPDAPADKDAGLDKALEVLGGSGTGAAEPEGARPLAA